ncbi:MAG: protein kinase family protein [Nocardioides sp.]
MSVHRPGDVLAGRYRLADLLSETEHGRFWLAHDSILGRPVAVHVLDADDPRAPRLMAAARASASIADQRLLRVLDAESREGISYVVNEWGRGSSLDILLARSGPLSAERAAWITAQVAATLAKAHHLGYAHGRLNPENVLIDEAGAVRVIGFAVEAALYGLPEGSAAEDDTALAGILTACLTGTWPGTTPSSVPATPLSGGHPLRPRQVRAGVPRVLDELCELALNPDAHGRHSTPVLDARYLHDRLMEFVGEPPDLSELPSERGRLSPETGPIGVISYPTGASPVVGGAASAGSAAGTAPAPAGHPIIEPGTDLATGDATRIAGPTSDAEAAAAAGGAGGGGADDEGDATQHGLPSFEDDDSWHRPRDVPAPPPPPLDPPAPKPLFADEPHTPRDAVSTAGAAGGGDPIEFWPWVDDSPPRTGAIRTPAPDHDEPPRSRWLPYAVGFVVLLVVVSVALIVRQATDDGPRRPGATDSPTRTGTAASPITNLTATDFDPFGDPPDEYPEDAHLAVDGRPGTAWHTSTYTDQLGDEPPALKSGVGLVIDLKRTYALATATLTVNGGPTDVSLYVTDTRPTTPNGLKAAARVTVTSPEQRVPLHNVAGRYLVVWLTSLPHVGEGYRGSVAEIGATGTRIGSQVD